MTDVQGLTGPVTFYWPIEEQRCCTCNTEKAQDGSGFCETCRSDLLSETRTDA